MISLRAWLSALTEVSMLLLAGVVGLRFLALRKASLEADDGVEDEEPSPSLPVSIIIHTSK